MTFYTAAIRAIRGHKDHLNKNNHQLLFVRHYFKIGVLSEMKQDPNAGLKWVYFKIDVLSEMKQDPNAGLK